jgi:preprotein translocase subunit SecF
VGDAVFRTSRPPSASAPEAPLRIEWVAPKAGEQLRDAAIQSLLYTWPSSWCTWRSASTCASRRARGLAVPRRDPSPLGIYVLLQKEMNLTTVAALLTVLGYSINDTIVIFDRIRENMGRYKDKSLRELINISPRRCSREPS